jgi:CelD/BcsL family acetyltransferase involved in cellulose biosynthesis
MDALVTGVAGVTGMIRVTEVHDRAQFARLEREWDALVAATGAPVFLRHAFLRIWIDNFAPGRRLRVLVARDGAGELVAALPLMQERLFLCGVPVRALVSTANAHSCRFDALARDGAAAGRAFAAHLSADPGWDVLRMTDVPEGGNAWRVYEALRRAGHPVGTWESLQSPYVPLPRAWEQLAAGLRSKLKANLRRRRKKLAERGEVTFERCAGGIALDARLEEGFALEASGWKGARGTAMAQSPRTRGFYTELARWAQGEGLLSLLFLRAGGRAVAFHYALAGGGRCWLLKPAYDEALGECSPGQLLVEEALKDCIGRGLNEFDFLGPRMTWKEDWTDRVRVHTWLFAFRDSPLGRALREAKFRWIPAAREAVARWRR